ncbi:DUF3788 family protein [Acetoanaerobium sticklandii]|uniref:DUF3788 family protein n=1 Tax=Acetoanaerobium sticklandii TaxID=1511 RepID=UPI003A8CB40D
MKSSDKQLLRNPDIQPTSDIIAEALQDANDSYIRFFNELENQDIHLEWRFYTDGKAWLGKGLYKWLGIRGGQKVTTVFWLSIWEGFFKITIYIPEKARDDLFSLPLNNTVKQMINDSKQMGNRLKFFPLVFELNSNELFEQIHILFDFKKSLK